MFSRSSSLAALLLAASLLASPARAEREASMYGTFNIPLDDFNEKDDVETGFGGGIDAIVDIAPNLAWASALSVLFNYHKEPDNLPSGVELGSWLNVPIMTGIRVQTPKQGPARGYLQFLAGLNMGTHTEIHTGSTHDLNWAPSFGFGIGMGVIFNKFHAGARFYHLGKSEHEDRVSGSFSSNTITGIKVTPVLVHLLVGFHFDNTN